MNLLCQFHYLYLAEVLCVNRIQKASATNTMLKGRRSVEEETEFTREFLVGAGRELALGNWSKMRMRMRPASAAASQISKGILRHEPRVAWEAISATPAWQRPFLLPLTVRAWNRDRLKLAQIGLPAEIVL